MKAKNQIQIKGRKDKGGSEDTLEKGKRVFQGLSKDNRKVLSTLIGASTKHEVKEVKGDLYYIIDDDEVRQNKDREPLLMRSTKRGTLKAVADLGRHTLMLSSISKPRGSLPTPISSGSSKGSESVIPEIVVIGLMYTYLSFAEVESMVNTIMKTG